MCVLADAALSCFYLDCSLEYSQNNIWYNKRGSSSFLSLEVPIQEKHTHYHTTGLARQPSNLLHALISFHKQRLSSWSPVTALRVLSKSLFHSRADSGSVKLLLLFLRFSLLFIAKESRRQIKLFKQQRSVAVLWFCFVPLLALVFTSTLLFLRSVSQPEQNDCKHIFVVPSQIPVLGDFHSS